MIRFVIRFKQNHDLKKLRFDPSLVTIVNAVSATGHFIPTAFIFGRKKMKKELFDAGPPGCIGLVSESSSINSDLFMDWLSHFKDHVKPTKEQPVLLILDNHVSHCTIQAVEFYRKNNIIALTLSPHSSHQMQRLDRDFHGVLKNFIPASVKSGYESTQGNL